MVDLLLLHFIHLELMRHQLTLPGMAHPRMVQLWWDDMTLDTMGQDSNRVEAVQSPEKPVGSTFQFCIIMLHFLVCSLPYCSVDFNEQ